jgi:peptide chain release factor 3
LSAVDSAIMVLDAAKGIETQTLKLFEVCRLRNIPNITFINKMDREAQDPMQLMDEIADNLQLDVTPASWPIGMGRDFRGCYDLFKDQLVLFDRSKGDQLKETITCTGLEDPTIDKKLDADQAQKLREDVDMIRGLCSKFDPDEYLAGHMTPVFFGSAVNNFGVQELLKGIASFAPSPRAVQAANRVIEPAESKVCGFVFKIQANMDPKHRDRIAFLRLCSGVFKRGMKLNIVRTQKPIVVHSPLLFFAQDREMAEEAYAGDIIGIPNHGNLRIGDVLTEGENLSFHSLPSFAPEYLQRVLPDDPLKAKHLGNALQQLAEEGVARIFRPNFDNSWIVGVVGQLQFDVLADRIRTEYSLPVRFESTSLITARWLSCTDNQKLKTFLDNNRGSIANDHDGDPVFMARNAWHLNDAQDKNPDIKFMATK